MAFTSIQSKSIEWLRFACAVAVVFLHNFRPSCEMASYKTGAYDSFQILCSEGICRVAVPIFFFISGFLFFSHLENWNWKVWRAKIKKRTKTLLIPYLLWNVIAVVFTFLMACLFGIIKGAGVPSVLNHIVECGGLGIFWDNGTGLPYNMPLWFIRNLMVLAITSPLIYLIVRNLRLIGVMVLYGFYLIGIKIVPGFELVGIVFFAFGAFFAINNYDFGSYFEKTYRLGGGNSISYAGRPCVFLWY